MDETTAAKPGTEKIKRAGIRAIAGLEEEERFFKYQVTSLEKKSILLGHFLRVNKPITAVVFDNATIAWTTFPIVHADIEQAVGGKTTALFEAMPHKDGSHVTLIVSNEDCVFPIYDFLKRSRIPSEAHLEIFYSPKNTDMRPVYKGLFDSFGKSIKPNHLESTSDENAAYIPRSRAITYHLGTGRIASAVTHGIAYQKLGIKFGLDLSLDGISWEEEDRMIIYFPFTNLLIIQKIATALLDAGESPDTILRYNIKNVINGHEEKKLREFLN